MNSNRFIFGSNFQIEKTITNEKNISLGSLTQGDLPDTVEFKNQQIVDASETVRNLTEDHKILKDLDDYGRQIVQEIAKDPIKAKNIKLPEEKLSPKGQKTLEALLSNISQLSGDKHKELKDRLLALKLAPLPVEQKNDLSSFLVASFGNNINFK